MALDPVCYTAEVFRVKLRMLCKYVSELFADQLYLEKQGVGLQRAIVQIRRVHRVDAEWLRL